MPDRLRQLKRLAVVVCDEICEIRGSVGRERLDPVGREAVLLGSPSAWDLAIRNVAHEGMPEHVRGLACDRGATLSPDELLSLDGPKRLFDGLFVQAAESGDGAGPEDLSDDRSILQNRLLVGRERVKTRSDDAVDGLR